MSSCSIHKVICPYCGEEQEIERYDSLNNYHIELFSKILDKSIFKYECVHCNKEVFDPQPLLFHKTGINDIQIGYKITPFSIPSSRIHPYLLAFQLATGENDISERYDNIDEFINRVKDFLPNVQKNILTKTKVKEMLCKAIDNIPDCAEIKDCYGEHSFGSDEAFIKVQIKVKEDTDENITDFHNAAHNAFNVDGLGFIS